MDSVCRVPASTTAEDLLKGDRHRRLQPVFRSLAHGRGMVGALLRTERGAELGLLACAALLTTSALAVVEANQQRQLTVA